MNIHDLRTPCVLVDQSKARRNLERMQSAADARGLKLRPHAKTHKSPMWAAEQIARGAVGICCAKLGEAEVFANAGIGDIRLPYPLNPVNADRVLALADRVRISFIVDDLAIARAWSDAVHAAGRTVDVLVKVDVGFHRCGIDPESVSAAETVARVADMPGLRLRGLLSHAGQAYGAGSEAEIAAIAASEARVLGALAEQVRARGVPIDEISVGATPPARFSLQQPGITELRPGNYIYFDRTQVLLGAAAWDDCALTVLSRVVSRPAPDRVILDAGSKTLTNDMARGFGPARGHGAILRDLMTAAPDETLSIERLSEEHANVRVLSGETALRTGDLVRIVPNHSCVVSNMVDEAWLVDGERVVDRLPIAARGRIT